MPDNTPLTKADFEAGIQQFVQQLKEYKEYIDERTHVMETRLLRAFSDDNHSASVRLRLIALEGSEGRK